jgi:alanyl-tRNA synthetase
MPSSQEIRQQFIDFFVKKHGHTYVPSSPVVPHEDPTLLFANAGMNQFKDVFLGLGTRPYTRAANTQKCIRAGGKHNDLEDVGRDTYHHTFFEMLGNWSFGDYFKAEAIDWAWELLTKVWKLDPRRLHATYFGGDPAEGLAHDDEARQLWLKRLPADHVHPGSMKDNFWEMGETGPCGPCSEIHYDLTADLSGGRLVNAGDPRTIEIWNLVFIQFNRQAGGKLLALPNRHVDTGMGFERICAVLQDKTSNYETDVFAPLFAAIQKLGGSTDYGGSLTSQTDTAYRVIADHARTLTFAITDGAMPSNEGRGYVLRRILRRAVRYGRQHLGIAEPFLHKLVNTIAKQMGGFFPELGKDPKHVAAVIREEEESFIRTLDRGIALFEEAAADKRAISADDAFKLYDTYGFPLDLTQLMAAERGMSVDVAGFERLMDEARQRSRAEAAGTDALHESLIALIQKEPVAPTQFVGYDQLIAEGPRVLKLLVRGDATYEPATGVEVGQMAVLAAETTPFYAEAGGQVGDTGVIHSREGAVFQVSDTQKIGEVYFHFGRLESGRIHATGPDLAVGDELLMEIDQPRRQQIMRHHTATHLMNWALRETLGDHVQQKGSLVDAEKTRFDFSHGKSMTAAEVEKVQKLVNERIAEALEVYAQVAPQEKALQIHGLRAVFGEKYPPQVRVVSIGVPVKKLLKDPDRADWREYSVEFCGGTHLKTTDEAERFVILSEEAVGKGVRRVTAVAGELARRAVAHAEVLADRIEAMAGHKGPSLEQDLGCLTEVMARVLLPMNERVKLRDRLAELQEIVKQQHKEAQRQVHGSVVEAARELAAASNGGLIVAAVQGADASTLRTAMDVIRKTRPESAMLLAALSGEKVAFLAAVPQPLIDRGLSAGDWVRQAAQVAGGGGGGRPDMAQAGGKNPAKLPEALEAARKFAQQKLG